MKKKTLDHPIQERAIQTRKDLLDAARRIFARDGFEVARLQDIAQEAGKTRGALYAHFKDKEDLFFALFEEDLFRDRAVYKRRLRPDSPREARIAVVTSQLEKLVHDRKRVLLYLEFKMYALRHPHKQKRLADLHAAMCDQGTSYKLELLPELAIADVHKRRRVIAAFASVLDGLTLNLYFDPEGFDKEDVHRKVEQLVRERFEGFGEKG